MWNQRPSVLFCFLMKIHFFVHEIQHLFNYIRLTLFISLINVYSHRLILTFDFFLLVLVGLKLQWTFYNLCKVRIYGQTRCYFPELTFIYSPEIMVYYFNLREGMVYVFRLFKLLKKIIKQKNSFLIIIYDFERFDGVI